MTKKPENWNEIESASFGYDRIEPGGYILKVIHAGDIITPKKKEPAIKFYFDIAQGEYINYYKELSARLEKDITLPYLQLTENERSIPYFKRLIEFFEISNPGYNFDFVPLSLTGKLIGAVLGEEEYLNNSFEIKTITKIVYFCPISTIINKEYKIPKKKLFEPDGTSNNNTQQHQYNAFFG